MKLVLARIGFGFVAAAGLDAVIPCDHLPWSVALIVFGLAVVAENIGRLEERRGR